MERLPKPRTAPGCTAGRKVRAVPRDAEAFKCRRTCYTTLVLLPTDNSESVGRSTRAAQLRRTPPRATRAVPERRNRGLWSVPPQAAWLPVPCPTRAMRRRCRPTDRRCGCPDVEIQAVFTLLPFHAHQIAGQRPRDRVLRRRRAELDGWTDLPTTFHRLRGQPAPVPHWRCREGNATKYKETILKSTLYWPMGRFDNPVRSVHFRSLCPMTATLMKNRSLSPAPAAAPAVGGPARHFLQCPGVIGSVIRGTHPHWKCA